MKFTDGYWQLLPGVSQVRAREVVDAELGTDFVRVFAPARVITHRGDTLNCPQLTITAQAVADSAIAITIEHFQGRRDPGPHFEITPDPGRVSVDQDADQVILRSGDLQVRIATSGPWSMVFERIGVDGSITELTASTARSIAAFSVTGRGQQDGDYVREQLSIGVGEHFFGLGERFGPLVKNGQSIDIWQADGGTASEQSYKNVPFHLSDRGYGVLVDTPAPVSYEIGSEAVSQLQFSVPGQKLRYLVIDGPTPKQVISRYTGLTGRPARVPAWSYGLWLSTSFTTDYDEQTVLNFVDGMAERNIPLSVFHFDCFWMRSFHWSDFVWDPATFPDPEGLIDKLHQRGLKVSVWINPYIAQRSHLFAEGAEKGYLVTHANGDVWQWDLWQAGMGLVDFTNPEAAAWYESKLKVLMDQGVDCFKTDFGERIPLDVVWHDGSDPLRMHNWYTQLYNKSVFELLQRERGQDEAVVFARSATVGGQQFPVHWGGDCESTLPSMAESLRGGLSLSSSGFGYWSHDIGGFEGNPDPEIFQRWVAFGLLSSHSRLHGSSSYRVPWLIDEQSVEVTRRFVELKLSLMPYLGTLGEQAHAEGIPVMRPMVMEFDQDRSAVLAEHQYLLGDRLLVAPVFEREGRVSYYLPEGTWTQLLTGEPVAGGRWVSEQHDRDSVPVLVRPGSVLPMKPGADRPDFDWTDGVVLRAFQLEDGQQVSVSVARPDGSLAQFEVSREGDQLSATGEGDLAWFLADGLGEPVAASQNQARLQLGQP